MITVIAWTISLSGPALVVLGLWLINPPLVLVAVGCSLCWLTFKPRTSCTPTSTRFDDDDLAGCNLN